MPSVWYSNGLFQVDIVQASADWLSCALARLVKAVVHRQVRHIATTLVTPFLFLSGGAKSLPPLTGLMSYFFFSRLDSVCVASLGAAMLRH